MNGYLISTLKNARIAKGLKQSDVAELLGVKNTTISNYETGVSNPDIQTLLRLCEIYGIDYSTLLGESFGISIPGTNFKIRPSDIEHLAKLHKLDAKGRELVDFVIKHELSRMEQIRHSDLTSVPMNGYAAHENENPSLDGEIFTEEELRERDKRLI